MINVENIPQKGTVFGLYKDKMVYEKYTSETINQYLNEDNLLEIHFFDQNTEYRYVNGKGIVVNDETSTFDDKYNEDVFVLGAKAEDVDCTDDLSNKVRIVNYIKYDENDMIRILNYRLKEM